MIRPVLEGKALVEDVRSADVPAGRAAFWWLGQSGYVVKAGEKVVVIDPYLSDSLRAKYAGSPKPHERMTACPVRPDLLAGVDVVLATHKHSDHMDPQTLPAVLEASPAARLVLPASLVGHVAGWGVDADRLVPADADRSFEVAGIEVLPVPAAHERLDVDADGRHLFLGYLIRVGGVTVYHAGDTVPYPGLLERLRAARPDVAILPINGRDARRVALGTPGNCSIDEALCVAAMAEVGVLVPCHYDLFAFNTADVGAFRTRAAEAWPDLRTCVLRPGERTLLP